MAKYYVNKRPDGLYNVRGQLSNRDGLIRMETLKGVHGRDLQERMTVIASKLDAVRVARAAARDGGDVPGVII